MNLIYQKNKERRLGWVAAFFILLAVLFFNSSIFVLAQDENVVTSTEVEVNADDSSPIFNLPQAIPPSQLIDQIYRFGLGVGAFLAFAWIVYSGFIYAWGGDNPSVRSDARDRITQALLGLLLLIGATALLNIINSRLTNLTDPILIGVRPPPPASIEDLPPGPEEGVPPGGFPEPSAEEAGNEASVRAELSAAGIPVNKGACPPGVAYQRYPGGCTSVGGVKRTTLDYAIWLKGQCGCSLTVTGGSELGHSNRGLSHSAGYKLDFGHSGSSVTAYINAELLKSDGRFKSGSRRGGINGGPRVYHNNASGQRLAEWVNEGDHWDVTVYNYPLN